MFERFFVKVEIIESLPIASVEASFQLSSAEVLFQFSIKEVFFQFFFCEGKLSLFNYEGFFFNLWMGDRASTTFHPHNCQLFTAFAKALARAKMTMMMINRSTLPVINSRSL